MLKDEILGVISKALDEKDNKVSTGFKLPI